MSLIHTSEETPLLSCQRRTPLPWFQLSIALFLHLAEPLAALVINPFAPQLIRDIGVTHGDEARVGYYVGLLPSLFYLAQAMTILYWSWLSDRIGRKPVLLIGLAGCSFSLLCFGLSKTLTSLLISRFLGGALDGNVCVIKGMIADIANSTNIAQAYGYLAFTWALGATLAPMIGGFFPKPADRFPNLFGNSEFMKNFPYFLPCAVVAIFAAVAWIVTLVCLNESGSPTISLSCLSYRKVCRTESQEPSVEVEVEQGSPLRALLTSRVLLAALNYGCFSLIEIAFRAINPLFLSTPIEFGGLGLSPSQIGTILSIHAGLHGIIVALFFPKIHGWFGTKAVFRAGVASGVPVFACFPILNYIARSQGVGTTVWVMVMVQMGISILSSFAYPAIFIYIVSASPNRSSLGATNGLAQTIGCIMRSIGPAAATSLFSKSIEKDVGGLLVYRVLIATVLVSLIVAWTLPEIE